MASREASAEAPTAARNVLDVVQELRAAMFAGGRDEPVERREARMHALIYTRRDEITMTLRLMLHDGDPVTYLLNNALLGLRFNKDVERPEAGVASPIHPVIHLQSLRRACPKCEGNACGRKGKFHDVTYKTLAKSASSADLGLMTSMGWSTGDHVLCKVDPDTGRFSLPPGEAIKALREWGENAIRAKRRWVDRAAKRGDRWKIREIAHWELYANTQLLNQQAEHVEPMTAD